jgi:acyl-CoA synthetase (AMP-forming)/AMP-acid ligase II
VRVSVRGPEGDTLPPGEVGEICVAGENVFLGYVGENGRQPGDFFGDAVRTGNLGSADAAGTVTFRGFLKPMFTRNGFNVYPREIERALAEDPRIAEVRVCALPDAERENDVVLTVRPAGGAALDEAAVRDLCSQLLAAYKQPSRVIFLEEQGREVSEP